MSSRRILGPINRVEGDLEVQLEAEADRVVLARVNSPLFRGFEQILHGKHPNDALVYTPRICGICSVSQSVAAARALADLTGTEPAENGRLASNLILAAENMADHLTHFYLFFMPDFARDAYAGAPWHAEIAARFKTQRGTAHPEVLRARAELLHLTAILAGKWPHSLALQPGGTTRPIEPHQQARLRLVVRTFRIFLESTLFGDRLEQVVSLDSAAALESWTETHGDSDFGRFLRLADKLDLASLGRGHDRFLSYGAYDEGDRPAFATGTWQRQAAQPFDQAQITEDLSHSWTAGHPEPRHPFEGNTIPTDGQEGYSWCKAPRLAGQPMEVGALARQLVDGHPLVRALVAESGGNVRNRVIARLLELARVVPLMEDWASRIRPGEPFCSSTELPTEGKGMGLVEAARGSLGHWLRVHKGHILNYQIIAPTTWNFSPRDAADIPGPLEQALADTDVSDARGELRIQHIIRSFDPCMVCTVH